MGDILVSLHGNRVGLDADGNLVVDGVVRSSTRNPITTVVTGKSAAGAITLTGAAVGDHVVSAVNLTTPADASDAFEGTISVAGQIQQTSASDLSASKYLVTVQPRS